MIRLRFASLLLVLSAAVLFAREPASETAVAVPRALTHFKEYEQNPVFVGAGEGYWDVKIRERGWILRDGGLWHLWYTGYDGTREGVKHLGHATSEDGLHWTRDRRNPLDAENWIEDLMIVRRGETYYMFAEGRGDQAHWFTSPDGIKWTRQGAIDIRLTSGEPIPPGPYGTPTVWFDNDRWHLMYERGDKGIWLATSRDLKIWKNVQDEPVLKTGPEAYDKEMIAANQVIKFDGKYYCIYHGSGDPVAPRTWTTNLAISSDGIHWSKFSGNPIVPRNRSSGILVPEKWNAEAVSTAQSSFEFPKSARLRLYTMHDKVEVFLPAE